MKKFLDIIIILTVIIIAAFGTFAFADEATPADTLTSAVNGVITNTLIPLIVAFLGSLVGLVLLKLKKKFNLQIAAETEAWIQSQAENAVQLVTEKAAQHLKFNNVKLSGNQKLDMAVAALISKTPNLSKDQANRYIHAALARIPGVGATGDASLVPGASVMSAGVLSETVSQ